MIAAALLLATLDAAVAVPSPINLPINLEVREEAGQVRLSVVGLADTAYGARYTLEVSGRGPAGVNRTTQGGATTLKPHQRTVLLTVAFAGAGAGQWRATLVVTPMEGAPYRQERASATTKGS